MVQTNGVFYMKTVQERELEKRVEERKRELMESYRAQKEEKRRATMDANSSEGIVRREERDESVRVSQVSNELHAAPALEQQSHSEPRDDVLNKSPSFTVNTGKCQNVTVSCILFL